MTGAAEPDGRAPVAEFAPAKINLSLHVTGRRADGYHLLDSLVIFADAGDRVTAAPAARPGLSVTGPRAAGIPAGEDNLVLRAARLFGAPGVAIALDKRLPAEAGLGGGSSDAAATIRALARMGFHPEDPGNFDAAVARLGADVPVCLAARPLRMEGVGERLSPAPALPPAGIVLVNPGVALATRDVFAALGGRFGAPMPHALPEGFADAAALAAWLRLETRNDLEPAALSLAPVVGDVLAALAATPGCLLARMSGSGASCFGLYADRAGAEAAAAALEAANPGWWVRAASPWQAVS